MTSDVLPAPPPGPRAPAPQVRSKSKVDDAGVVRRHVCWARIQAAAPAAGCPSSGKRPARSRKPRAVAIQRACRPGTASRQGIAHDATAQWRCGGRVRKASQCQAGDCRPRPQVTVTDAQAAGGRLMSTPSGVEELASIARRGALGTSLPGGSPAGLPAGEKTRWIVRKRPAAMRPRRRRRRRRRALFCPATRWAGGRADSWASSQLTQAAAVRGRRGARGRFV